MYPAGKAKYDSLSTCISRINGAMKDKCVTSTLQNCIKDGCTSIKNTKPKQGSSTILAENLNTKTFMSCTISSYLRDYGYTTCF